MPLSTDDWKRDTNILWGLVFVSCTEFYQQISGCIQISRKAILTEVKIH